MRSAGTWAWLSSTRRRQIRPPGGAPETDAHYFRHVRRCGQSPHDAQDLTQEFFRLLLEKRWLEDADREKGRLRSFLITALKRFMANEWRRICTDRRGGGQAHLAIDTAFAESRYAADPGAAFAPDEVFDRQWAFTLLELTLERLQAEFDAAGKAADFGVLSSFLALARERIDYGTAAARLAISEGAARVAVQTVYLLVFGATVSITFLTPELFASTARILFTPRANAFAGIAKPAGVMGAYDPYLIQRELEVIQSALVLGPVIHNLDLAGEWSKRYGRGQPLKDAELLNLLKGRISLRPLRNANIIGITAFDEKPELAAQIANEIVRAFVEQHSQVEAAGADASGLRPAIIDRAVPGLRPVRPNKPLNTALGALGGLVFGAAAGAGRVYLKPRKQSQTA